MSRTQRVCPKCSSRQVVRIAYGLPGYELMEMEREGKVVLGGCLVAPDNPKWHCKNCGNEWGKLYESDDF